MRVAADHLRQLPREIVRVVDAGVAAEAAVRRHEMRGVADDENAAVLESLRHIGGGAPARVAVDAHRQVRLPTPARTSSIMRASLTSAAAFIAASGSRFGSPSVLTPRKPTRLERFMRKNPASTGLFT